MKPEPVSMILFATGFILLVLGYPGPLTLVLGGGFLLGSFLVSYSFGQRAVRETPLRDADLGVKGPGPEANLPPVKPSLGWELKRRLEEE